MKGLILAGGLGTRLRPLSHTGPKQLVPIANKPVLYYVIEDLKEAGIKEIGIIVGYTDERIEKIKNALGDGSRWDVKITYIRQDAPRGLAHAVGIAEDFISKDDFVVYLGDNMIQHGIKSYVDEFKKSDFDAGILLAEVEDPTIYGVAVFNEKNEVIDLEEKPEKPKSKYAIVGVYMFTKEIFPAIKQTKPGRKGEYQITDSIRKLVLSKKHKVSAHIIKGWWDDTGTTEAVLNANKLVLDEIKTSVIKSDISKCKIKEPVNIGKKCILENCQIGPYVSVGNNVAIKDADIENTIILNNVKIDYPGKITGSLIGKYAKLLSNKKKEFHTFTVGEHSEVRL